MKRRKECVWGASPRSLCESSEMPVTAFSEGNHESGLGLSGSESCILFFLGATMLGFEAAKPHINEPFDERD